MRYPVGMRFFGLLLPLTVVALFACHDYKVLAQTRAEADAVKSLINNANEERPLLMKILGVSDAGTLEKITNADTPKSRIGRMLWSLRIFQLNEKQGGLAVLRSLPRSDIEMEALNEFTHQKGDNDFRPMYRDYYSAAFRSVVSHPAFLQSIFQISTEFDTKNWPDYDDADWYCSELAKVRKAMPELYDQALSRESTRDKPFLSTCGSGH
ncbi:MAG TPA: hypothetical protein VMU48_19290 [Terracidiphilus sp.]|nr:hypothetical protein [Terracidiphilus sp.]